MNPVYSPVQPGAPYGNPKNMAYTGRTKTSLLVGGRRLSLTSGESLNQGRSGWHQGLSNEVNEKRWDPNSTRGGASYLGSALLLSLALIHTALLAGCFCFQITLGLSWSYIEQ